MTQIAQTVGFTEQDVVAAPRDLERRFIRTASAIGKQPVKRYAVLGQCFLPDEGQVGE